MNARFSLTLAGALVFVAIAMALMVLPASAGVDVSFSPVYWFEDTSQPPGNEVAGAKSTLIRTDHSVIGMMRTSQLRPGHAYTVWWVVFNNPNACTPAEGGCGVDDVVGVVMSGGQTNPAGIGVLYATGGLSSHDGRLNFAARLDEGDASGCVRVPPLSAACGPLRDASAAEIHMVLHDHGPPIPGKLDQQLRSFEGGCQSYIHGPSGTVIATYNLGDYACFSPQASPHKP